GAVRSRPEEDAFEMPELLSDREHLTGGQGAVAEEYRHSVARERGIGEDVNVLEVHASNCRTGARCPAVQAREITWHAASAPTRRSATNPAVPGSVCALFRCGPVGDDPHVGVVARGVGGGSRAGGGGRAGGSRLCRAVRRKLRVWPGAGGQRLGVPAWRLVQVPLAVAGIVGVLGKAQAPAVSPVDTV